jgi:hypothetical protein
MRRFEPRMQVDTEIFKVVLVCCSRCRCRAFGFHLRDRLPPSHRDEVGTASDASFRFPISSTSSSAILASRASFTSTPQSCLTQGNLEGSGYFTSNRV